MIWLIDGKYIKDYQVWIKFNDNTEKIIDLKEKIFNDKREIFLSLKEIEFFNKVKFNPEIDTIVWPNGADLSPEYLYDFNNVKN